MINKLSLWEKAIQKTQVQKFGTKCNNLWIRGLGRQTQKTEEN